MTALKFAFLLDRGRLGEAERVPRHLDMLILSILETGPRHGYAVIEELRRRSDEALDLPEGTIYPALHRLERSKLIEGKWFDIGGRRRRTYALTTDGRRALREHRKEWVSFASMIQRVLGGKPWPSTN